MWVLLSVVGLLVEMTIIVVLGRRATAAYEEEPFVARVPDRAPTPAHPGVPPEPAPS